MRGVAFVLVFALLAGCASEAQAGDRSMKDMLDMLMTIQTINHDPDIPVMYVPSPIFYKAGLFGKRHRMAVQLSPINKPLIYTTQGQNRLQILIQ